MVTSQYLQRNSHVVRATLLVFGILACWLIIVGTSRKPQPVTVLRDIVAHSMPLAFVALGVSLVISAGDIDLSSAGLISVCGSFLVLATRFALPPSVAILGCLLFCAATGWMHGKVVTHFGVSPLVLTLGSSFALAGLATVLDVNLQAAMHYLSRVVHPGYRLSYRSGVIIFMCALATAFVWRYKSIDGVRHLACGLNRDAALSAALATESLRTRAFVLSAISSFPAALMVNTYTGGSSSRAAGQGYELLAIAGCVIGGTRISGGYLQPVAVALSAVLIRSIDTLVRSLPFLKAEYLPLGVGLVVLVVALVDRGRK